jgi:hypothetical protein
MRGLRRRALTAAERMAIEKLAHSRTAPHRTGAAGRACAHRLAGAPGPDGVGDRGGATADGPHGAARDWIKRFNAQGLAGLEDRPRAARPPT